LEAGQTSAAAPDLVAESAEGLLERAADASVILDKSDYGQIPSVPRATTWSYETRLRADWST
jgi:hypothetical protein